MRGLPTLQGVLVETFGKAPHNIAFGLGIDGAFGETSDPLSHPLLAGDDQASGTSNHPRLRLIFLLTVLYRLLIQVVNRNRL